jgi:hypothetical protein
MHFKRVHNTALYPRLCTNNTLPNILDCGEVETFCLCLREDQLANKPGIFALLTPTVVAASAAAAAAALSSFFSGKTEVVLVAH